MSGVSSATKAFLKRGEGRLGTSVPTSSSVSRPAKRTLHLKHPQARGAASVDGSIDDDEPRSYSEMRARHSAPQPTSVPSSPDKAAHRSAVRGMFLTGNKDAATLMMIDDVHVEDGHLRCEQALVA